MVILENREYLLRRLDQWCSSKIRAVYCEELEQDLRSKLEEKCGLLERPFLIAFDKIPIENKLDKVENFFSQAYGKMEEIVSSPETFKGLKSKDLDQIKVLYQDTIVFLESVDQKYKIKTSGLEDRDIDTLFLEKYKDYKGFSNFVLSYLRLLPVVLNTSVYKKKIPWAIRETVLKILKLSETIIPYVCEKTFGNLGKKAEEIRV
jgi:hypothetical protein